MSFGRPGNVSKVTNRSSMLSASSMGPEKRKETFWEFVKRIALRCYAWGTKAYSMSKYLLWCASIASIFILLPMALAQNLEVSGDYDAMMKAYGQIA